MSSLRIRLYASVGLSPISSESRPSPSHARFLRARIQCSKIFTCSRRASPSGISALICSSRANAVRPARSWARARPTRSACLSSPCTPSHLMSSGSVVPCNNKVPTTTTKVRNKIASRAGNCDPSSTVSGMAKAAARLTTPRIPAHDTTNTAPGCGDGSRSRIRGNSRAPYVAPNTQTMRIAMVAANTAAAAQQIAAVDRSPRPSMTCGSWSPMSRNTNDSRMASIERQTAVSCRRVAYPSRTDRWPR